MKTLTILHDSGNSVIVSLSRSKIIFLKKSFFDFLRSYFRFDSRDDLLDDQTTRQSESISSTRTDYLSNYFFITALAILGTHQILIFNAGKVSKDHPFRMTDWHERPITDRPWIGIYTGGRAMIQSLSNFDLILMFFTNWFYLIGPRPTEIDRERKIKNQEFKSRTSPAARV